MIILEGVHSGRARCRECRQPIAQGAWRVGVRGYGYLGLSCFMSAYGTAFLRGLIPLLTDDQLRAVGLEVEHIEPEPSPEPDRPFSVGDRVRVRADRVGTTCEYGGTYDAQWEGTVDHVSSSGSLRVHFDDRFRWSVNPDEVELIPPPTPEPAPEPASEPTVDRDPEWWHSLRPGDHVRVTNNDNSFMNFFSVGEELEVHHVEPPSYRGDLAIQIIRSSGTLSWVHQNHVDRVMPEPPSDPDPEWWRTLEPGDMVRVTDVETHPSEYHMGPFTVGQELEVESLRATRSSSEQDIQIRRPQGGTWWVNNDSVERV